MWNVNLIRNFFPEEIAEKILSIPISTVGCNDFASWPYSKSGAYTVRSAYNLMKSHQFWINRSRPGTGSSSKQDHMEKVWKKLWTIQCPNKMKIVLWRIAHNCLPTGSQLQVRSIPTRYDCCFCGREENIEHCFLQCQYVKEIWRELKSNYGICLNVKKIIHIRQWLLDWIAKAPSFHSTILAVAMWHIWENRNNHRNGETLLNPLRVVGKIKAYIEFMNLCNDNPPNSYRRETSTSTQKWSPPPEGWLMINVDAAIFSHSGRAGYGVVVRDHLGAPVAAYRGCFDHTQSPEVAEALAVRQALVLAKNAGFQKIQVASDCLTLINKLQGTGLDRSSIGAIVQDIKSAATKFLACDFNHVKRCCNEAAHVLAKSAEYNAESSWFNVYPDKIRTIICNEQVMYE